MAKPFLSGKYFDECAEVHDTLDDAVVDGSHDGVLDDSHHRVFGIVCGLLIGAVNRDRAVVLDVDLDVEHLAEGLYILPPRPDDRADLLDIDLGRHDLRRILRYLGGRGRDRLLHYGKYMQPSALGLGESLLEDFGGHARDLYIHLEASNAPGRARHLEIHVAEVILVPEDV